MQYKMNITTAQHVQSEFEDLPSTIKAIIDGMEMFVPLDPANRHYAEIMRQVEAGELTIEPAD
jgi:hypothetical protein